MGRRTGRACLLLTVAAAACRGPGQDAGTEDASESDTQSESGSTSTDTGDTGTDTDDESSDDSTDEGDTCGNGTIEDGEDCDDGTDNGSYGFCNTTCDGAGPYCGDGALNGPEECDDANDDGLDACTNLCLTQACGDDVVDPGDLCYGPVIELDDVFDPGPLLLLDLDADQHLDLVVGEVTGAQAVTLLGDGSGAFVAVDTKGVGPLPHRFVPADFDGDGVLDVLSVARTEGYTVLRNAGAGLLSELGSSSEALLIAYASDLDGDDWADLVRGHVDDTAVNLGLGDGSFGSNVGFAHDALWNDFAITPDLDEDDKPDLVIALDDDEEFDPPGEVRTLFGVGDGTFTPGQTFELEDDPDILLTALLDGDDRIDLVAMRGSQPCARAIGSCGASSGLRPRHPTLGEITTYVSGGQAAGELVLSTSIVIGFDPSDLGASDLDNDGDDDLVIAHFGFGWLEFLRGDGIGGLERELIDNLGFRHGAVELGDLNEDGVDDIVLSRGALGEEAGVVRIRLSNP